MAYSEKVWEFIHSHTPANVPVESETFFTLAKEAGVKITRHESGEYKMVVGTPPTKLLGFLPVEKFHGPYVVERGEIFPAIITWRFEVRTEEVVYTPQINYDREVVRVYQTGEYPVWKINAAFSRSLFSPTPVTVPLPERVVELPIPLWVGGSNDCGDTSLYSQLHFLSEAKELAKKFASKLFGVIGNGTYYGYTDNGSLVEGWLV